MNVFGKIVCLVVMAVGLAARGEEVYFGGVGDPSSHWVGYRLTVPKETAKKDTAKKDAVSNSTATREAVKWTAYVLDAAEPGKIRIAPATFATAGTDKWTAIFDETVVKQSGTVIGLAKHELRLVSRPVPGIVEIQDGKNTIRLLKMSPDDLKSIERGEIPKVVSEAQVHPSPPAPLPQGARGE